jgi:hypothetical protein
MPHRSREVATAFSRDAHAITQQGNWQGGTPPLPPDSMPAPKELVDAIREKLQNGVQPPACVLWGQPGVGKSTLAVLSASTIAYDSQCALYWVKFHPDGSHDLEQNTTPAAALRGLAKTLSRDLPPDSSSRALVDEIKSALSGGPYIVVCDNVRDESELNEYDLRSVSGIVLATSLSPAWEYFEQIEITVWGRQRCRDYIGFRLADRLSAQASVRMSDSLAKVVGYLPLGLAQSTSYIRYSGASIHEYIARFEANAKTLLGTRQRREEGRGPAYKTIRSTCYMLFGLITSKERDNESDLRIATLYLLCVMGVKCSGSKSCVVT